MFNNFLIILQKIVLLYQKIKNNFLIDHPVYNISYKLNISKYDNYEKKSIH